MIKIGIDARSLGSKVCGVSRVVASLINALALVDEINQYYVYLDLPIEGLALPNNYHLIYTNCNRMNMLNDFKFSQIIGRNKLDVLHVMHSWIPFFLPKKIKKIVTIYDVFPVTDDNFFSNRKPFQKLFQRYFRFLTLYTLSKVDLVITISNYCKNEIRKISIKSTPHIEIMYLPPGITKLVEFNNNDLVGEEYILYLGNYRSYKNIDTLIKGFSHYALGCNSRLKLVMAGNDDVRHLKSLSQTMGILNRVFFIERPDDKTLDCLYKYAKALVLPSINEGYGLTAIEAMGYGVPVLISNAEALIEVYGDAALIFDKSNPKDLSEKINRILTDNNLRAHLVLRGYDCVRPMSWLNNAERLKALYESS
jgi:glycosyltransferase involved in cell wall biosynthesis